MPALGAGALWAFAEQNETSATKQAHAGNGNTAAVLTYEKYHEGDERQADDQHDDQPHKKQAGAPTSRGSAAPWDFLRRR